MASAGEYRPRIVVADDHPSVLVAFCRLLQPSCDVVASVAKGQSAVDAVLRLRPDILVVDLMMPDLDGLEVCRQVRESAPETDVVIVSAFDDEHMQRLALQRGASAFVPKHSVFTLPEMLHHISAKRQGIR